MKKAAEIVGEEFHIEIEHFLISRRWRERMERAMKTYAEQAINHYADEAKALIGNRTLDEIAEIVKQKLE